MSVTLWDRLRRALRREASDIEHAIADATHRGHEVMDEKERELAATSEERLLIEQQRAERADEEFEALKRQIEREAD
jgi:F0F1-type ATP synthase membrane subunit b/b'